MTSGLEKFFSNHGYGTYRLTQREKRYIMRTFEPKANNAPSLAWVGHFVHKQMAYTLHGNLLTRAGWVSSEKRQFSDYVRIEHLKAAVLARGGGDSN